jgi:biotin transport system substrate-specific component
VIHGIGIGYLIFLTLAKIPSPPILTWENLPTAIFNFSLVALPGQIILVCLSAVLAFFIRKLLFY